MGALREFLDPREPKLATLLAVSAPPPKAGRIRKNVGELSGDELATLIKAFQGIMLLDKTDPENPNGYFNVAGLHGLPGLYCMHHIPGFNPWHRYHMLSFENALRSIDGCQDVTLPYWDMSSPLPDIFHFAPFDFYTLPKDLKMFGRFGLMQYPKGYKTQRNSAQQIAANLNENSVLTNLKRAATKTDWEDFHGFLDGRPNNTFIAAHDGGHVAIGPTMADQNIAAFDPVFWFYHCNLDRLYWNWQKSMSAETPNGLLSTVQSTNSRDCFTIPALGELPPCVNDPKILCTDTVDSVRALNVDYKLERKMLGLKHWCMQTFWRPNSSLLNTTWSICVLRE